MRPAAVIVAALVACSAAIRASADIVYDNTTTRTGAYHEILADGQADGPEHGNQVTLAGTDRRVTNIAVVMRILGGGAASFKSTVRLYANDGPEGQPGTPLWTSAPVFSVIDGGADLTYGFAVPSVLVPDTVTWTIQLTERNVFMAPIGIGTFTPPSIGSAAPGFWHNLGGGWEQDGFGESPFGSRITAIPAPSGLILAAGFAVLARRRVRGPAPV